MKRVRTPGLGFALLLASAGSVLAADGGATYSDLPGAGKPVRAGTVVTTEGGIEGTQTVFYREGESRRGQGQKLDPNDRRGLGPVATSSNPGVVNAGGSVKNSDKEIDINDYEADPVTGRYSAKEAKYSDRRYDAGKADAFSKDNRFAGKDTPEFGRWGREGERHDRETSESFGTGDKYDTTERPEFGRWAKENDKLDRRDFSGAGDRADVKNWEELFARDKNGKFSDSDISSSIKEKMTRFKTYEQISMQAINRTAFRRSHSDDPGALPVTTAGSGKDTAKPMSAPKTPPADK